MGYADVNTQHRAEAQPSGLLDLYLKMLLIRLAEQRLGESYKRGDIPGPVHLYIGQEAIAVGVCAHLQNTDWITSTHRGHGHFLAKGGGLRDMFDELYGKASGICKGKGGSMHVADVSKGMLGANGIVGGGLGIATGAALAAQLGGGRAVSVAFFGDGASNQGVLAESMNVAALWKLPLVYVCEANGYSEFSTTSSVTAGRIADRPRAWGIPTCEVDGNDVEAVGAAASECVARARSGEGPSFILASTYRIRGHVETEQSILQRPYRTAEEIEAWRLRDPLDRARSRLLSAQGMDPDALKALETEIEIQVQAAFEEAQAADDPHPSTARQHMFA